MPPDLEGGGAPARGADHHHQNRSLIKDQHSQSNGAGQQDRGDAAADLACEAIAIRELKAGVIGATDIGVYAVELAIHKWKVFPLAGKNPRIPSPHPKGSWERKHCKGKCGQLGHGLYDATSDVDTVIRWWSDPYKGCNIGGRIPESMLLIDVDPRAGGHETWAALEHKYGPFPECMMQFSGRGDGGTHRFVRLPAGQLNAKRLGPGIDFKTSSGCAVMAPSVHPASGKPYVRVDGPIPAPPQWFIDLVTVPPPKPAPRQAHPRSSSFWQRCGGSPVERYNAATSWADVLMPHGWACRDGDSDGDGAVWLHPTHTSNCSATISDGSLYVYSTSTPFDVTESGRPRGYSKFAAYAVLNHGGDMKAAARALKGVVW
jgi:hypothetical protein